MRSIGCALLGVLTVIASIGAPTVRAEHPVDVAAALVTTEYLSPTSISFGVLEYEVSMYRASSVPGTSKIAGLNGRQAATLDVETGELRRGDVVPGLRGSSAGPRLTFVSADGAWFYIVETIGERERTLFRFDVETLSLDRQIALAPVIGQNATIGSVAPIPGLPDAFVFAAGGVAYVLSGGEVLANTSADLETFSGIRIYDVDVVATSVAVATGIGDDPGEYLYRLGIDESGFVDDGEQLAWDVGNPDELSVRGDEIIVHRSVYDIDGDLLREASPFDLAWSDPADEYRYLLRYGEGASIFWGATGEQLTELRPCPVDSARGVLLGGGRAVDTNQSVRLVDLHDACANFGEFTPVTPARVFDSRTGLGAETAQRIDGGSTVRARIHGGGGVPDEGVESVLLNVTAVNQAGGSGRPNYLTVWPAGYERPEVATVNVDVGATVGNTVAVATSADGYVEFYSHAGSVDVVIDVMGYYASSFAPPGARFRGREARRVIDTRSTGDRLGPEESLTIDRRALIDSDFVEGIDGHVVAAVLNVTAIRSSTGGHFRIHPSGEAVPEASSMNFPRGRNVNRLVTVKVGNDGAVDLWNANGEVDVAVDVVGAYVAKSPGNSHSVGRRFVGIVPERVADTRESSPFDGDGRIPADDGVIYGGYRNGLVLAVNLTAVNPSGTGFVSSVPIDAHVPLSIEQITRTSRLNFEGGTLGNQAIVRVGTAGELLYYSSGRTHLTVDLYGFFTN